MKILVTGGAGFIGSHIVEKLLENNHKVTVIDNLITGKIQNLPINITFYHLDILTPDIEKIFAKEKPEVVIHHAAQVSVQESLKNPLNDCSQNILATINILEMCKKYKVRKIIYASTAAVYGIPQYFPIDEKHPTLPISFYGLSKLTSEYYIQLYSNLYNIKYTILRYANVFGERQNMQGEAGVIPLFISRILNNLDPIIFGDGEQTRDFVFVNDVALANVLAINNGDNQVLNISSNNQISINTMVNMLSNITNKKIKCIHQEKKQGDIVNSCLQNKKGNDQLKWQPRYSFYQGLKETIEYYKQN
jgi:UDP-glucose 4-epimerase